MTFKMAVFGMLYVRVSSPVEGTSEERQRQ